MRGVQVTAYVEASRKPQSVTAVVCGLGAAVVFGLCVLGVIVGVSVSLFALIPAFALLHVAKNAAQGSELRAVQASVTLLGDVLTVRLPASRLFDGRYVDQVYTCGLADLDGIEVDDGGMFRLRARSLSSDAYENEQLLDYREHEFMEVSFKVASREDIARLRAFVTEL